MSNIHYYSISRLITNQQVDGHSLKITFTCPKTGETVESQATMQLDRGVGSVAKQSAMRNAKWSLVNSVSRMLGYNMAGRVARDVTRDLTDKAANAQQFGSKEKQEAAVKAFNRVVNEFAWDDSEGRWVHKSALGS